ncbi:flagellar biosynthesis anti-sigma factor FlgM [Deltaproteobacteria bacterium OttesenSCG-928-M10]|nr:flagellar biosynthesis anti-sigma factor FlgM [Deltaproteobacteria bacterium OttesenSCG-928-M10]
MKIDALNILNKEAKAASDARNKEKPSAASLDAARTEENKGDVVQLSDRSRLIARSQELAAGAPDVREDRVSDIKARLAAGTYNVSGQTVAEAMIRKSITEV